MEAQPKQKHNYDNHQQKLSIVILLAVVSYLLYITISSIGLLNIIELSYSFRLSQLLIVLISLLVFIIIYLQNYNRVPGKLTISLWIPGIISSILYLPLEGMNTPSGQIPAVLLLLTFLIPLYSSSDYLFIKLNIIRYLNKYSDSQMLTTIIIIFILYILIITVNITIYTMISMNSSINL
jgi:hypothetical protein